MKRIGGGYVPPSWKGTVINASPVESNPQNLKINNNIFIIKVIYLIWYRIKKYILLLFEMILKEKKLLIALDYDNHNLNIDRIIYHFYLNYLYIFFNIN
jgi:hypothetical protein